MCAVWRVSANCREIEEAMLRLLGPVSFRGLSKVGKCRSGTSQLLSFNFDVRCDSS